LNLEGKPSTLQRLFATIMVRRSGICNWYEPTMPRRNGRFWFSTRNITGVKSPEMMVVYGNTPIKSEEEAGAATPLRLSVVKNYLEAVPSLAAATLCV
jgi:hypothetical protein